MYVAIELQIANLDSDISVQFVNKNIHSKSMIHRRKGFFPFFDLLVHMVLVLNDLSAMNWRI